MNQEKIGTFIADIRKSQGMSQKQLANIVGVTDKSVSKWENGKSLPEISKMEPLCDALHININELLSGERLSEAVYLQKAEENMLNLIHESEIKVNQTNSVSVIMMIVLSVLLMAFIVERTFFFDGTFGWAIWIDMPTIVTMIVVTVLYLIGTKTMRAFRRAFVIVSSKKSYTYTEIYASAIAVKMFQVSWLITGVFMSALGYVALAINAAAEYAEPDRFVLTALNLALATLGIVYGLIGYLILIPIKTKLELYMNK